jgi:hypothetical protein
MAYFLFDMHGGHPVYVGTRFHTKEAQQPEFLAGICARLGAGLRLVHSTSERAAETTLARLVEAGTPVLVWAEVTRLPYYGLTGHANAYHTLVVYGDDRDRHEWQVADRSCRPLAIRHDDLGAARLTTWSPRFRAAVLETPERAPDLAAAVRSGLRAGCDAMLAGGGIANLGLGAYQKWADALVSTRDRKGWPRCFPPGLALYKALSSVFGQIETRGVGQALRPLFADCLDEAAALLGRPALGGAAQAFRESGAAFASLGEALLPDGVAPLGETRRLLALRMRRLDQDGMDAAPELARIGARLAAISAELERDFPLGERAAGELLEGVRGRVLAVRDAERAAFEELDRAL